MYNGEFVARVKNTMCDHEVWIRIHGWTNCKRNEPVTIQNR